MYGYFACMHSLHHICPLPVEDRSGCQVPPETGVADSDEPGYINIII